LTPDLTDQIYIVFDDAKTFTHAAFQLVTTPISHSLCGGITVTAKYDNNVITTGEPVLSYDASTRTFTADSDDATLIGGTKSFSITAQLTNYPTATNPTADSQTITKNIFFQNPCLDPFTFVSTSQTDPSAYGYTGTLEFALNQFTITPSICGVTYACTGITRSDGLKTGSGAEYIACSDVSFDGNFDGSTDGLGAVTDGKLTFSATGTDYTNDVRPPGTYTVTITGTATESSETQTATFSFTLTDVCNPLTSLTAPGYVDQTYVLTATGQSYTPTDFVASPSYCPFTTAHTISDLSPASLPDAVSKGSGLTWDFAYSQDLLPLGQTQTVTVTATATTAKTSFNSGAPNVPTTQTDDFDLTFTNPCLSTTYTTLSSSAQGTSSFTDDYSGASQTFTYTPYTVTPNICPLTVTCKSITGPSTGVLNCVDYPIDSVSNQVSFSFDTAVYQAGALTPGAYTFTYTVSTGGADAALNQDFSFTLTLSDPCAAAVVTPPTFSAQEYTISDVTKTLPFASSFGQAYSVSPAYCATDPALQATTSATLDSKLSFDKSTQTLTINQFFDSLELSGGSSLTQQTYTVTFTYQVFSPYSVAALKTETNTMNLTIKNPCVDTSFVTIEPYNTPLANYGYVVASAEISFFPVNSIGLSVQTTPVVHSLCGAIKLKG